jgi:HlyD family secretion protein
MNTLPAQYGLLVFLMATVFFSCNNGPETRTPDVKPLMEAVYSSGFIVSEAEYQVFAQVDGILREKPVKDGELVKEGQVLFTLESEQQYARSRAASEAVAIARKNALADGPVLLEAHQAIETARMKSAHDSINYVRFSNLWKQNATSKAELDRALLLFEASRKEYLMRQSSYQRLYNSLQVELQNAEANMRIAQSESGRYQIRSTMDGVLYKTTKEPGELVRRTESLGVIGKAEGHYFRMKVDEQDIIRIKTGQEVLIKIDAFPDRFFKGTVARVHAMIDPRDQSIRVDATLEEPLPGPYTGLAAEGNIIVRKKEKALVIPRTLLLTGDSIWVQIDGKKQKVKVVKGVETLNEVEIVGGIDETTQLVLQ